MPDKKISALDAIPAIADADLDAVVDATDSTTKKATALQRKTYVNTGRWVTVGNVGSGATYNSIEDARAAGNKSVLVVGVFNETKDINLGGGNLDVQVLDTLNMVTFVVNSTGGNLVLHGEKITTAYTVASTKFFNSTNGDITFNCNEFNTELNFGTALGITNITGTGRTFANGCKFRLSNNAEAGFKGVKIGSIISNCEAEGGGSSCKEFALSAGNAIFSGLQITGTFEDGGLFIEESGGNCNFSDFLYDGAPELKITLAFNNNNFSNIKGDFNIDVTDTNYTKIANFDIKTLDLSHGSADFNTIINGRVNTTAISIGGERNKLINIRSDGNLTVEGSNNKIISSIIVGNFTYGVSAQLNEAFMCNVSGSFTDNGTNNIFINQLSSDATLGGNSDRIISTQKALRTYIDNAVATVDTWDKVMHLGSSFTVLNTENISATITQNDTTNNPAALVIANTGSGNDITLPNSSYIKNGAMTLSGVLSSAADTDATIPLGRAAFSSPTTDVMMLSHFDRKDDATTFAIRQVQGGATCVNSRSARNLSFCIAGATKARIMADGTFNPQLGQIVNITTVNAATYDLLVTDYILHVTYTGTGAVTSLTLPTAQAVAGRVIHIKDAGGLAGTNSITIDTQGAEKIDGLDTLVISANYNSASLYSDGSHWFTF